MKIKNIHARWLHVPIPEDKQHVSDFGRVASFDSVLVRIETECGLVGWGEAKEEVRVAGEVVGAHLVDDEHDGETGAPDHGRGRAGPVAHAAGKDCRGQRETNSASTQEHAGPRCTICPETRPAVCEPGRACPAPTGCATTDPGRG